MLWSGAGRAILRRTHYLPSTGRAIEGLYTAWACCSKSPKFSYNTHSSQLLAQLNLFHSPITSITSNLYYTTSSTSSQLFIPLTHNHHNSSYTFTPLLYQSNLLQLATISLRHNHHSPILYKSNSFCSQLLTNWGITLRWRPNFFLKVIPNCCTLVFLLSYSSKLVEKPWNFVAQGLFLDYLILWSRDCLKKTSLGVLAFTPTNCLIIFLNQVFTLDFTKNTMSSYKRPRLSTSTA